MNNDFNLNEENSSNLDNVQNGMNSSEANNSNVQNEMNSFGTNNSSVQNDINSFNSNAETEIKKKNYFSDIKEKIIKNKKSLVLVIMILFVIIGSIFVIKKFFFKSSDFANFFNPNQLISVEKDGKYGYINSKGKMVLDPIYEEASNFVGNYAEVEVKDQEGNSIYQLIDSKGKVKAETDSVYDIEYISDYNVWVINNQLYNSSLKRLSKDNVQVSYQDDGYLSWTNQKNKTAGYMNTEGKVIYTYKFQNDEYFFDVSPSDSYYDNLEQYCIINVENKKYGIVNCETGKIVYDLSNHDILDENNNVFSIYKDSDMEELDSKIFVYNDKIAYQTKNENADLDYYSYGYLVIREEEQNSYYLPKQDKIVKEVPQISDMTVDEIPDEWEQLTNIKKEKCDSNYKLVKNNKDILSCEWDSIKYLGVDLYQYLKTKGKDYVYASKDNKMYIVDLKNGKIVTEFSTVNIKVDDYSTFIYYQDAENKKTIVYNLLSGKSLTIDANYVDVYANYITVDEDDHTNYYNTDLKLIYSEE